MFDSFKENLEERKKRNLYRSLKGSEGIDFTSNDYLSLSENKKIKESIKKALEGDFPLSPKASRLLGGSSSLHEELEEEIGRWMGVEGILSFSSGFQANTGLIPALSLNHKIFSDELNHASLIEGIRLSKSPRFIYPHKDLDFLEDLLKKETGEKIIITESLFSMEGDMAPLEELQFLANKYQGFLFVDEAHSTGLFGKNLSGLCSLLKKRDEIVSLHTGGKALSAAGAFSASSLEVREYLINNCKSFIYTTALSPLVLLHLRESIKLLRKERRKAMDLRRKAVQFRESLGLEKTESPIVFIKLKDASHALKASSYLKEKGFFIPAIRTPTVPKDKQGLRIVLHSSHRREDLKDLIFHLKKVM